ncbi:MAG: hypothetical protein ACOYNP_19045 [Gemmataceae bacterium]|jgi:hypothetical protein
MIRKLFGLLPLKASLAGVILSAILLIQASAASAATLSEDMVQASKDACINLAKRRGFTVEKVINAQPAPSDSASVVLKLMKAGEPYEFKCGFSQAIDHFVEPAPAATGQRVAQAPATAQRQQATVNTTQNNQAAPKADARQDVRRERAVVVERNQADVKADRGRFNAAWLLPLLLLPLAAFLFRNKEEEAVAPTRITTTPTVKSTSVEAQLRNQDTPIEVRSGAGTSHPVTRTIPAGSKVRLSGRYENDWAELAESGWIHIPSLSSDPRVSAVKSY